ncbi:MAG: cell wall-binding repeat-containing protein, partial [Firmicutes bacterium]|nr:cell wall-binding repeat-containing protein [Bacillota bacterium]
ESGCYEYVMPITESTVPGEYTINQISAWDSSDNSVNLHYSSADFSAGSFIVSGTTSDETPPAIDIGSLQLTLPESMEFAVTGDSVKVRVSVSDEGLGVSQVTIQYRKPVSGDDECIRLTYNSETEKWENEIRCDKTLERGTWKIYSIEALDRGGNLTRIINSEFDSDSGVDLSAGDFQLRNTVTFDTRGGSNIDPQYVMLGEKATRPADPTKGNGAWQGGGDFAGWYADEAFTQYFNFNTPITEDTTIYARWAYGFSICSYDKTNNADYDGGKYMVLQHGMTESDLYYGGSNFTLYEGEALTLKAVPDPGYKFAGWYKGEYIGMVDYYHTQVSRPLDMSDPENLLSSDLEYSFVLDQNTIICPVFEVCEEHQWDGGTVTKKATCTGTGTKTFKCTACGTEKTEELPALGHKWTGPAWSWDGYIKATATFTCSRCQAKEKVTGKSDGGVLTKKPTATATGIRTYTVSVKGIDGKTYTTTKTETLAKTATELKETHVTAGNQVYNGTARKPAVVKVGTKTLTEGTDYTATYQNNQNVGTATVTITGKGNYTGTVTKTFAITQASLKNAMVSGLAARTYNGTAQKPAPTVKVNLDGKTLTLKSSTDYTVTYKNNTNVGTATVTITGKGNFKDAVSKTFPIKAADIKATTVTGLKDQSFDGKAKTPAPTLKITLNGKTVTLKKGTDYAVRYKNNTDPGQATVTLTGKGNFTGTKSVTFKIVKQKGSMERLAGADRYATSLAIADQFKKEAGVSRFKALILADGINYPDALAGSYLGLVKDCPVISVAGMYPNHQGTANAIAYIKRNLVAGGQIYIVGGEGSVDPAIEKTLKAAGYKVKRLAGNNRYLTNLEILKEAKIKAGSQFIVCTGAEFADALSASATGKPLLLVAGTGKTLTAEQKAYLQSAKPSQFFVVGDAKVVSNEIVNELKTFAPVTRVGSGDAYSRSLAVTRKFFTGNQMVIQVADGRNFPDGLCGGALAARRKAPLLLSNDEVAAVFNKITDFAKSANAIKLTVFGGTGSVSDKTAKTVIGLN